jgi:hypothetical protein
MDNDKEPVFLIEDLIRRVDLLEDRVVKLELEFAKSKQSCDKSKIASEQLHEKEEVEPESNLSDATLLGDIISKSKLRDEEHYSHRRFFFEV